LAATEIDFKVTNAIELRERIAQATLLVGWNTRMGDILITELNTAFEFTALWLFTYLGGDK